MGLADILKERWILALSSTRDLKIVPSTMDIFVFFFSPLRDTNYVVKIRQKRETVKMFVKFIFQYLPMTAIAKIRELNSEVL